MSVRTRLAFMVILILLGCVFAAPYYRTQVDASNRGDQGSALPTLQIQRTEVVPQSLEVTDVPADTLSISPPVSTSTATNRFRFSDAAELAPIPALEMPPLGVSDRQRQKLAPIAVNTNQDRSPSTLPRQKLKPVSLIGEGIGADAAWGGAYDRKQPGPRTITTLKPQRMQQFDERRLESRQRVDNDMSELQEISSREFKPVEAAPRQSASGNAKQTKHRIVNGDTLEQLSTKYYGSPEYARFIFQANRQMLVSPAILPLGKELVIPANPEASRQPNASGATNYRTQLLPVNPPPLTALEYDQGWRRRDDVDRLSGI